GSRGWAQGSRLPDRAREPGRAPRIPPSGAISDLDRTRGSAIGGLLPGPIATCTAGAAEPSARGTPAWADRDVPRGSGQPEQRHVPVERLGPARLHLVGLVPDADRAVRADAPVE